MRHDDRPVSSPSILTGLLRPATVSAVLFMLVTGIAYPLLTTGVAQLLFPGQAQGSLIRHDGAVIGSTLIGQDFVQPGYFHPRPSAIVQADPSNPDKTIANPYDPQASGGSNLGPTSKVLMARIRAGVRAYRQENGLSAQTPVPVDAVTASASGLDPDISVANARLQAGRVARSRHLPVQAVLILVDRWTTPRQWALLGEPRINVLQLNLALDASWPGTVPGGTR